MYEFSLNRTNLNYKGAAVLKNILKLFLILSISSVLVACPSSDSNNIPAVDNRTLTLFISGESSNRVYVFNNASAADGAVVPDQVIAGAATNISGPCDIGYDSSKEIIYAGNAFAAIVAIDNSTSPTGDVASDRVIAGAATFLANLCGVEVDAGNDRLFVGGSQGISIFDNGSTVNGNIAPDRRVTGANTTLSGNLEVRLFLDTANDRMYAADPSTSQILVFNNASTMDGNIAPDRAISGANTTFVYNWGISVDVGRDILYSGDSASEAINIFDNASTVDGNIAPNRTVSGAGTGLVGEEIADIFIDTRGNTLYVVLRSSGEVLVWNNASTVNGNVAPDRVITGLIGPNGIVGVLR